MAADFTAKHIAIARNVLVPEAKRLLQIEADFIEAKADLAESGGSFLDADFAGQDGLTHLTAYTPGVALGDFLTDLTAFLDGHLQDNAAAATRRSILHNLTGG